MQVNTVAFSNGSNAVYHSLQQLAPLQAVFAAHGVQTRCGACLLEDPATPGFTGGAQARANALNTLFADVNIDAILDISGGDAANGMLSYLDYAAIKRQPKPLFGYSDMTCVLNAVYARCGIETYLYQVRHLTGEFAQAQQARFFSFVSGRSNALLAFSYHFYGAQKAMQGVLVGGNLRCFLKLAGTPYFPDCRGKILFLEAYSGDLNRLEAYLHQLAQMGVFQQCSGILLGTCTQADREYGRENVVQLVHRFVNGVPFAATRQVGHGQDSRCVVIGRFYRLEECKGC